MEGKRPTRPGHREDTVANDSTARQGHQGWHNTHAPRRTRSARDRALVLPATSRPKSGSRELGIACGRGGKVSYWRSGIHGNQRLCYITVRMWRSRMRAQIHMHASQRPRGVGSGSRVVRARPRANQRRTRPRNPGVPRVRPRAARAPVRAPAGTQGRSEHTRAARTPTSLPWDASLWRTASCACSRTAAASARTRSRARQVHWPTRSSSCRTWRRSAAAACSECGTLSSVSRTSLLYVAGCYFFVRAGCCCAFAHGISSLDIALSHERTRGESRRPRE